jgi:cell fate regulator YaaT (PSP1 superfamily)
MSESRTVVAVKLRYNPKIFWFDPVLSTYEAGDHVLVDTERGREIGLVVDAAVEVTEKQLKALKSPLKPVIRALDESDFSRIDELDAKGRAAMTVFRELIEKHELDVKPVSVEFLFSGDKAVFYFSNDERVDFRDLVRDLAAHFHTRVDMRQIGVRDEARILGGLAHCGEELCCARLGGEFQPVSIRMAKEQDLPLNPSKISGACGRLMCCLRYEFEAYRDFKGRAPKKGALIETPIGKAKVIDFDTPREIINMRLEDGKPLSIPLSEFGCEEDANGKNRPCCVSRDAIDRCASSSIIMALAALEQELIQKEAPAEREGERVRRREGGRKRGGGREGGREGGSEGSSRAEAVRGESSGRDGGPREDGGRESEEAAPTRRLRRTSRRSADKREDSGRAEAPSESKRGSDQQPRRRREAAGQAARQGDSADKSSGSRGEAAGRDRKGGQKARPRPGQHSSGLRNAERSEGRAEGRSGSGSRSDGRPRNRSENRSASNASSSTGARTRTEESSGTSGAASGDGRRRRRRSGNTPSSEA